MEQHYPFTLPPLPYGYDATGAGADRKVLYFHHDKHFAAYVDALNQLLERTPAYQSWPLWKLCLNWEELADGLRQGVRNNAGGVFNHDLYFRTLHPLPVSAPDTALEALVYGTSAACRFEGGHAQGGPGAIRLRLGLAIRRRRGAPGCPKDRKPGHTAAPDPLAVLRRMGARLLSPIPESPGGLLRSLVATGGLA